jgi:SAM-dependent methyltransferase
MRTRPGFASYLPGLPAESVQTRAAAVTGEETLRLAFREWRLVMRLYAEQMGSTTADSAVLDFGCGWGRFTRFFLRDFEPRNIRGIDPDETSIRAARETNPWCGFARSDPAPPTGFEDGQFDLVFGHSVFSHLPEALHLNWLAEFRRILRPGGLAVLTTLPRSFLDACAGTGDLEGKPAWLREAVRGFAPVDRAMADYDAGRFCYAAGETNPDYGYACISERYARVRWLQHLDVLDYIADRAVGAQDIIVARRPEGAQGPETQGVAVAAQPEAVTCGVSRLRRGHGFLRPK